jgi:leader peptidase (prepilin peptidase)/N-methyltransferase
VRVPDGVTSAPGWNRHVLRGALVSVALCGVSVLVMVATDGWALLVPMLLVALVGGPVVVVDLTEHRIPTPLVWTLAVLSGVWATWQAVADGTLWPLGRALLAGTAVAGVFWVKWWWGGTGRGDLRLAAVLAGVAGWLGWAPAVGALVIPYLLVFPVGVWKLARGARGERIPFGPALVLGWFVAVTLHLWAS